MAGYIGNKAAFLSSTSGADIDGNMDVDGNITLGDNDKAIFGAGSDLQIYHDGSNSYIKDAGTGDLKIQGANVRLENPSGVRYFQGSSGVSYLYNSGDIKLNTTSTGVDITGTLTSDGLTVDGDVTLNDQSVEVGSTSNSYNELRFFDSTNTGGTTRLRSNANVLETYTSNAKRMSVTSNGDISFYEDTGTTPKFFWDASAESLGIGTSSPLSKLHLENTSSNDGIRIINGTSGEGFVIFGDTADSNTGAIAYSHSSDAMTFDVNNSERMRIDSSGNLLVGKTSSSGSIAGAEMRSDGYTVVTRDGSTPMQVRRLTNTSGDLIEYYTASQKIGSIGFEGGDSLIIQSGTTAGSGLHFHPSQQQIVPARQNARVDDAIDLGRSTTRFKDLYLSGLIRSVGIYNNTSGGSANLGVASSGEIYRSTSSLRYKTDITDATHGLTDLLSLRPVTYRDINGGETVYGGLIAEEVHDAGLTEFVEYNDDGEPDALAYANMVSLCIKAIQEQQTKIETLETENTAIKARLDALEA